MSDAPVQEHHVVAKKDDSLGAYRVVYASGVPVTSTVDRGSERLGTLSAGETVHVVEVAQQPQDERVRARIESPSGWISIRSVDGSLFAKPVSREDAPLPLEETLKSDRKPVAAVAFNVLFGDPPDESSQKRFVLYPRKWRSSVRIGRAHVSDMRVDILGVSTVHAELRLRLDESRAGGGCICVRDLSVNGTGLKLPEGTKLRLKKDLDTILPDGAQLLLPLRTQKVDGQEKGPNRRMLLTVRMDQLTDEEARRGSRSPSSSGSSSSSSVTPEPPATPQAMGLKARRRPTVRSAAASGGIVHIPQDVLASAKSAACGDGDFAVVSSLPAPRRVGDQTASDPKADPSARKSLPQEALMAEVLEVMGCGRTPSRSSERRRQRGGSRSRSRSRQPAQREQKRSSLRVNRPGEKGDVAAIADARARSLESPTAKAPPGWAPPWAWTPAWPQWVAGHGCGGVGQPCGPPGSNPIFRPPFPTLPAARPHHQGTPALTQVLQQQIVRQKSLGASRGAVPQAVWDEVLADV
eukprot:TRINITY_DN10197_c0_g1_i2.p1 TRINITY_DN10197_c0_g1~~TRINITY_DN10197_c0_g1_i2.p1  ORF type:complete len:553 (+),score=85.70 TRINITY_DN10197_c0_g1_i2:92-1660(+)